MSIKELLKKLKIFPMMSLLATSNGSTKFKIYQL